MNNHIHIIGALEKGSLAIVKMNEDTGKASTVTDKADIVAYNSDLKTIIIEDVYEYDRRIGLYIPVELFKKVLEEVDKIDGAKLEETNEVKVHE